MTGKNTRWNKILHDKIYSPEEPDDSVKSLVAILKKRNASQILDLACGAGRHVVYLAEQGFNLTGADFSETGLLMARDRVMKLKLDASFVKCDVKTLPFIKSSFDAVVCTRAIYHQKLTQMQETISEIKRVLSRNGLVLVDFLSTRTHSHGKGMEVEKNTFMEQEGMEKGITHHFIDEDELKMLFRDFEILDIKLCEKHEEGKLRSRWVVVAEA